MEIAEVVGPGGAGPGAGLGWGVIPVSGKEPAPGRGRSVKPEAETQEQLGWGVGEVARIWAWDPAGGGGRVQTQGSADLEGVWNSGRAEAWKGLVSTRS